MIRMLRLSRMEPWAILNSQPSMWLLAAAYVAGSIPFGLLLALLVARTDVRTQGSGNIGATNVARVVGKKLGILTLVLDAAKGAGPVLAASFVSVPGPLEEQRLLLAGSAGFLALLGHCFPVWLRFRGGKGVATGLGVVLAWQPEIAGYALLAFLVAFAGSRLVSVGSLVAAGATIVALVLRGPRDASVIPIALCFIVIVAKHVPNIRRLLRRQELRV